MPLCTCTWGWKQCEQRSLGAGGRWGGETLVPDKSPAVTRISDMNCAQEPCLELRVPRGRPGARCRDILSSTQRCHNRRAPWRRSRGVMGGLGQVSSPAVQGLPSGTGRRVHRVAEDGPHHGWGSEPPKLAAMFLTAAHLSHSLLAGLPHPPAPWSRTLCLSGLFLHSHEDG